MNIAIFIYDEAEVLDFSGPFEVFSVAKRLAANNWNVFLIGETENLVKGRGNYLVQPHHTISEHPPIDVLLVVGGVHTAVVKKSNITRWIATVDASAKVVASVCTGCFLLAEAGLLDGLPVTTHWEDIDDLRAQYPQLDVLDNKRWVQAGKYITSGGISAGIDMSLFLVAELVSMDLAEKTATQMEYRWEKEV